MQNTKALIVPSSSQSEAFSYTKEWLNQLKLTLEGSTAQPSPQEILYVLDLKFINGRHTLAVGPMIANRLKNGKLGKPKPYTYSLRAVIPQLDQDLVQQFLSFEASRDTKKPEFYLSERLGASLLQDLLSTNKCYWQSCDHAPLTLGEERSVTFTWETQVSGTQKLVCHSNPKSHVIAPLSPPWYIDLDAGSLGPIRSDMPLETFQTILSAPPVRPEETREVYSSLQSLQGAVPLPETYERVIQKDLTPVPCLHLCVKAFKSSYDYYWRREESFLVPVATLFFDYGQNRVLSEEERSDVKTLENGALVCSKRNRELELKLASQLKRVKLSAMDRKGSSYNPSALAQSSYLPTKISPRSSLYDPSVISAWLSFTNEGIFQLQQKGWIIQIDEDFPFQTVKPEEQLYSEIKGASGENWFDLELGVMVEGNPVNLLPILMKILKSSPSSFESLSKLPHDGTVYIPLSPSKSLALPAERVKTILSFLEDFYQTHSLTDEGRLRMSRIETPYLAALDAATKASAIRWMGGERFLEIGHRLKGMTSLPQVTVPETLQTSLRPYQIEGVNWLQFLREYNLAGILADDMGLGKTVQTIAHLLIEKDAGRLDKPVLLIAPTSLIVNWESELQRFSPSLQALILHGNKRQSDFEGITKHDIVLTTYPLLVRDQEELLKHTFHSVILDEAQYIKNAKTQTALIAQQLKADHRLCLTGTPLENHLGELWSLFNFLLPGFLGNERQFSSLYRKPIENGDGGTQKQSLARRIRPFILRRLKEEVAKELPPKTEVILRSTLDKDQRDLYETLRVSLHEKLQEEIEKKGFSRSHIMILDALLKLRQVCCDPRLLKTEAAQKVKESAKLSQLMEMLPSMIEEGRRVLLFSQFTSMLALIEEDCQKLGIEYVKLTGQTQDRKTPIDMFQQGKVPLFLISLKAGGTGLNLTAADAIIHYDPWWNPAVENQATDRAYRIGQDKPVFVYKLITSGTIEEKIVTMQARKAALAGSLFDPDQKTGSALTVEDIKSLFEEI